MRVCFFGPDGSGKSTVARGLFYVFQGRGFRVRVVWMRGSHTLASLLARLLSRFQVFRGVCNPYYRVCIPGRLKPLWVWIEFFSALPVVLLRFVLPGLAGYTVIGERSLLDFLVWLIVTLRDPCIPRSLPGKAILSIAYSLSDNPIYIYADLQTLLARRRGSVETPLIPVQLRVYGKLAETLRTPALNTSSHTVAESVKKILRILNLEPC